jgi:monofunctional chorismate mutase
MTSLEEARKKIDAIDERIAALLEERMDAVSEVVAYKIENNIDVLDSSREGDVRARIANVVKNPDYKETIVESFQKIMDESKKYQQGKKG